MLPGQMVQVENTAAQGAAARLGAILRDRRKLLIDYFSAMSGSVGRLVFSLLYFVALANALSLGDFGLFATASAAGVMLSRLLGFGFISALYRTATVRRRLIGTYTAGFLLLAVLSIPLVLAAGYGVYLLFFSADLLFSTFALVLAAEAFLWRPTEAVIIVNNGMGRFARASALAILGIGLRAVAAALFYFAADKSLAAWCWYYLAANGASLLIAVALFYPRQKLRLQPDLYWRRLPDSLYVAGAELLFYLQMEFDKLLVLAIGGANLAGVYAIIMRLVDLTAIPIRTFNMMLVQKMMRAPELLARLKTKALVEIGIFSASTLGILFLASVLHFYPNLLGKNVGTAAPLLMFALLIPGFRNLIEYQSELLFARGQTFYRVVILAILAALKGLLLYALLSTSGDAAEIIKMLNPAFGLMYLVSVILTYAGLRKQVKRV